MVPVDTAWVTRQGVVVPLRVGLGFAAVAILLLAMASTSDTRPWPNGVTTTGRVLYVQSPWSTKGGSARVTYRVDGADLERWLPDFAEQGRVAVGDPYLLEYRTDDPTEARGVAANRDDAELQPIVAWSGVTASVLAVAAVLMHYLGPKRPPSSSDPPAPRRSR